MGHSRHREKLEGCMLLMQFMRSVTLMRRWLVWLKNLQVGKVSRTCRSARLASRRALLLLLLLLLILKGAGSLRRASWTMSGLQCPLWWPLSLLTPHVMAQNMNKGEM
jgi:hypothetical protein